MKSQHGCLNKLCMTPDDRPAWMKRPQEGRGRVGGQRKRVSTSFSNPCMYEEHNVIQDVVGYTHV